MSKKVNTTIKIKCNDEHTANLFYTLLEGHAAQHKSDMNGLFARHGMGVVDTTFIDFNREKLTFGVTTKPTDKGDIFTLENGEVNITPYTSLKTGEIYGMIDQSMKVFFFIEDGYDKHLTSVASISSLKEALTLLPTDPQVIKFLEDVERQNAVEADREVAEVAEVAEEVTEEPVMEVNRD